MTLARAALARLSELLDQALDLPRAERAAWLAGLGDADASLRPQLEAMLADAEDATTGGATPVTGRMPAATRTDSCPPCGINTMGI